MALPGLFLTFVFQSTVNIKMSKTGFDQQILEEVAVPTNRITTIAR